MDSLKDREKPNKERDNNDPEAIKIILIGDSGTGKTNLITVSAGYEFNSDVLTTRACSFIQKKYTFHNTQIKVNIQDTIGQEKYRSLTKIFVKEAKIVILVYDITNRTSFESLSFWKKIVDDMITDPPVIGIVGNKMDLYINEQVKEEELEEYAKGIGAKYLLTSAKNDAVSFGKFMEELLKDYLKKFLGKEQIALLWNQKQQKKREKKMLLIKIGLYFRFKFSYQL